MSDEYQVETPLSFIALYIDPGRLKPNALREVVSGRNELCEDMASMLTEQAKDMFFSSASVVQNQLSILARRRA